MDAPGGQRGTAGPAGPSRVRERSDWLFFRLNFVWLSFSLGASGLQASRETSNPKMISDRLPSVPVTSFRVTAPPLINIPDNWRRSDRIYPDAQIYLLHMEQQNVQSVPITMKGKWKTAINRIPPPRVVIPGRCQVSMTYDAPSMVVLHNTRIICPSGVSSAYGRRYHLVCLTAGQKRQEK